VKRTCRIRDKKEQQTRLGRSFEHAHRANRKHKIKASTHTSGEEHITDVTAGRVFEWPRVDED
jgi:hypothetical protein